MREIVLDTETTGFDPGAGHRVVESGRVQRRDRVPPGARYQPYLRPGRARRAERRIAERYGHRSTCE